MPSSTFVWIDPECKGVCQELGFRPQVKYGESRCYIQIQDNPFNPTSDIWKVPRHAIVEVTIRAETKTSIPVGLYTVSAKTSMRVSAAYTVTPQQPGFFTTKARVEKQGKQAIDLRAPELEQALHIFKEAIAGNIKPDQVYTDEVMRHFD